VPTDLPHDTVVKTLTSAGRFYLNKVFYTVGARHGFQQVLVIADGNQPGDKITVTDMDGEILVEHTRPAPGVTYVGNGRPRSPAPRPLSVTDVWRHKASPMS
jgi:hypothetical protein